MTAPPDHDDGRQLTPPAPAMTPTAATTPKVAASITDQANAETAEAAEQLQYELHQVDECRLDCPWCSGRWVG